MKRSTLPAQKKVAGSYSRKIAAGHVPIKHSRFPKFGEVGYEYHLLNT